MRIILRAVCLAIVFSFAGCSSASFTLGEPRVREESLGALGTTFRVEKEPIDIPGLPGVQQVVLRAKGQGNGQIVALLIPPRHLPVGSEVEVRQIVFRDSIGSRTGEFPIVKNAEAKSSLVESSGAPDNTNIFKEKDPLVVKRGAEFTLSDGTVLTIGGQPVFFDGTDEYENLVYNYNEVSTRQERRILNPIILPAKIKDGTVKVGQHQLRIVSLTPDECRYSVVEETK